MYMLLFDKSVTDVEGNPVLVHVVWAQVKATTTHKKVVCVANRIFPVLPPSNWLAGTICPS